jgi:hypothetical protein
MSKLIKDMKAFGLMLSSLLLPHSFAVAGNLAKKAKWTSGGDGGGGRC